MLVHCFYSIRLASLFAYHLLPFLLLFLKLIHYFRLPVRTQLSPGSIRALEF